MKITIYSTSMCAACESLTDWLQQKGFNYDKKVTDQDMAVMDEFMSVSDGMLSVPFTVITDDKGAQIKISGFDRPKFQQALNVH